MKKIVVASLIILFSSCSEEEVSYREFPRVRTSDVVDISAAGAIFQAEMLSLSEPLTDHGFLWHDQSSPLLDNADKISLGPRSTPGAFQAICERGLSKGRRYFVRSYAISEHNLVYGNTVEFVSLGSKPPVLVDFSPKVASWGDTITLTGQNFSVSSTKNTVKFDAATAIFVSASSEMIRVIVPYEIRDQFTSISMVQFGTGYTSTLETDFQLQPPVITSVTPSSATPDASIVITGKFLGSSKIEVYFNNSPALITYTSLTAIKCRVPSELPPGSVTLKLVTGNDNLYTTTSFDVE